MWREKISHISKIREKRNRKLNLPINERELSKFRKSVVENLVKMSCHSSTMNFTNS